MPNAARSFFVVTVALAALLQACVTPRPDTIAPCINESVEGLILRWGTSDSTQHTEAYEMNTKGHLFTISGPTGRSIQPTYIGAIGGDLYCERANSVKDAFLQTQALNVSASRARFVEYVNPAANVYLRAVWNPDLSTFHSRYFRAEYEALMKLLPVP